MTEKNIRDFTSIKGIFLKKCESHTLIASSDATSSAAMGSKSLIPKREEPAIPKRVTREQSASLLWCHAFAINTLYINMDT